MSITPNPYPYITADVGGTHAYYDSSQNFYAVLAIGGFTVTQQFPTITLPLAPAIAKYNVGNAVQIRLPASSFNSKLGTYENTVSYPNQFTNYNLVYTATDLYNDVLAENNAGNNPVISVGIFSNLYNDYTTFVNGYFSSQAGSTTLFAGGAYFSYKPNGVTVFTITDLNNILKGTFGGSGNLGAYPDVSGGINTSLDTWIKTSSNGTSTAPTSYYKGQITIANVSSLLQYAANNNIFGNRSGVPMVSGSNTNKDISGGFVPGDLIYISKGIEAILDVQIALGMNAMPSNFTTITTTNITNDPTGASYSSQAMDELLKIYNADLLIELY